MPNKYREIKTTKTSEGKRYIVNAVLPVVKSDIDDIYIITRAGDRLDNLAFEYYGDQTFWWVISAANPEKVRRDSYYVEGGIQLRIPTDPQDIVNKYNQLNTRGR